ncbi:MAG: carboxymuconolactone decarboxylase family protein, partial [Phycisphaerales bacterium JB038]
PQEVIDALRADEPLPDARLESLRQFTKALLERRGEVGDERLEQFLSAGYSRQQALEVILGLALKTMSNYTNSVTHTKLDAPPKAFAWTKPGAAVVGA